ncbi:MAG: SRPBCC family protein [Candidatus Marinimicrobia bacterium]|nr:SRPBCC family protein [Candidatus Neomarinimicrobiota bacterium]
MAFYQFKREQLIPASQVDVWDFISSPANLKKITPAEMGFDIVSGALPEKMYAGMIVKYRVRPLFGIPTTWVTEITHVQAGKHFVDEQRIGPYKMWHHQHILEQQADGVLMKDIVSYQPPLGFLGAMANAIVIRSQLAKIFEYRTLALEKIFPRLT